jgi:hypothetical protein
MPEPTTPPDKCEACGKTVPDDALSNVIGILRDLVNSGCCYESKAHRPDTVCRECGSVRGTHVDACTVARAERLLAAYPKAANEGTPS